MTFLIIIGAIILLGVLFALYDAKNIAVAVCPKCNVKVGIRKGLGCCSNCAEPLQSEAGKFVPVEQGLVSDNLCFNVSMGKLKNPKKWQSTWQGRCCVCGNNATRVSKENVKIIKASVGLVLGPQNNITETTKFEIGYCSAHRDGIKFLYPPGFGNTKRTDQCFLYFRSVDFYREFINQNARPAGEIDIEPD